MNAYIFIKTLMDQLTTPTGKTKWRKQKHKFSSIFERLKALLGGCTKTLNMSVYFYPNQKLLWKEPWKHAIFG